MREPSLSHLQGLEVALDKSAASGCFLWSSFASFPHCENSTYMGKILPLAHFLDIDTQRKEDSEANDQ